MPFSESEADRRRPDRMILVCTDSTLAWNWRCRLFADLNVAQGGIVVGCGALTSVMDLRMW